MPPMRPLVLASSRPLRFAAFTALYFAQGVPIGLLTIALPAWLAQRGLGVAEIASYQGIIGLPWGLKLISGPLMDRFSFPAMGRRRPWVLGAQAGLTLAFAGLALVADPLAQLPLVIALGVLVTTCSALQDVATDGMAIDLLPEEERGRANAFMAFGQAAGFSSFSILSGLLLARFGLGAAALTAAGAVALVLALVLLTRERPGERALPWSAGEASPAAIRAPASFAGIFRGLGRVLLLPMGLVVLLTECFVRLRDGIAISVLPVVATQTLGFSAEGYASMQGGFGIAIAALGLAIGPGIDRYGAKRFFMLGIALNLAVVLVFATTQPLWGSQAYVIALYVIASIFGQMVFVSFISCSMAVCWPPVAASQFAIYMSLSNLARSLGAVAFALVAPQLGVVGQFYAMAALLALAFVLISRFDLTPHRERLRALDEAPTPY
ncbi:MAG: MFS transporter [Deltaproteobacteria bacterium]|nr:MFS transporter [Deltaproteobacteria bacterium]